MKVGREARCLVAGEIVVAVSVAFEARAQPPAQPLSRLRLSSAGQLRRDPLRNQRGERGQAPLHEPRGGRQAARRRQRRPHLKRAPLAPVGGEDLEVIALIGNDGSRLDHGRAGSQGELDSVPGAGLPEPSLPQPGIGAVVLGHPQGARACLTHDGHRLCDNISGTQKQIAAPIPQFAPQIFQRVEQKRQPVGPGVVASEDGVVEHEQRDHAIGGRDRCAEGRVIADSQVPVEQEDGRRHGLPETICRERP